MRLTVEDVEAAITAKYGYWEGEFYEALTGYRPKTVHLNIGEAEVVETESNPNRDSYGYVSGGHASVVFKINGQYFRKNGYVNSYGDAEYDGMLHEVTPHEETVIVKSWKEA
jgi:hypothetical protein